MCVSAAMEIKLFLDLKNSDFEPKFFVFRFQDLSKNFKLMQQSADSHHPPMHSSCCWWTPRRASALSSARTPSAPGTCSRVEWCRHCARSLRRNRGKSCRWSSRRRWGSNGRRGKRRFRKLREELTCSEDQVCSETKFAKIFKTEFSFSSPESTRGQSWP